MFNPNQAFLLVQKLKWASMVFYTKRVKAEIQKNVFNLPQVTNKCYVPSYRMGMGKLP